MSSVATGRARSGTRPSIASEAVLYVLLTIAALITLIPFLWMVLSAFKPGDEIYAVPFQFFPKQLTLENFEGLLGDPAFVRAFLNSVVVAVAVVAGNLLFCSMVGYALAKIPFRGRSIVFGAVLVSLMIPLMATFVPLFVMIANLGISNTYWALILPFLATPVGVFIMRQFTQSIPDELLEAARIDGAGELRIFWSVAMPLCRPALATLGILTFMNSWNSFLWPLVAAQSESMYTVPVALALKSASESNTEPTYGALVAGAVIVLVPVLIVFIIFQKQFIAGVATTGLK